MKQIPLVVSLSNHANSACGEYFFTEPFLYYHELQTQHVPAKYSTREYWRVKWN